MAAELKEVRPETAEALTARAKALGISIDTLLNKLLSEVEPASSELLTAADVDQILDELSADADSVPPLPADFSREDIYFDHD